MIVMIDFQNINIEKIEETMTASFSKGCYSEMKNRSSFGIAICQSGQITYTHNGKKIILNKDCAVILPKSANYTIFCNATGSFPLINFQCNGLGKEFISIPLSNTDEYIKDFARIKKLSIFRDNTLKIKSIFYDILNRIFLENSKDTGLIAPALKYIESNYYDPDLQNQKLAKTCNISEVYFRRIFAEKMGTTPKQYVLDIRIKRAKQLLETNSLTVSAVAEKCGFSSVYHFCRTFKTHTGITPTEFITKTKQISL